MSFRKVIGWHRWKHRKTFQENEFISSANVSEKAKYCSALEDRESGEFHGSGIKWMSEWILWTSISASNISFQHEIYNNKGETISDWSLNKLKATYKLHTPNALIKWQTIVRFLDTVKMNFVTVRHFFFFLFLLFVLFHFIFDDDNKCAELSTAQPKQTKWKENNKHEISLEWNEITRKHEREELRHVFYRVQTNHSPT